MNRIFIAALCSIVLVSHTYTMDSGATHPAAPECPICNEALDNDTVSSDALFGCHHEDGNLYHDHCMANWLVNKGHHTRCPVCRAPLKQNLNPDLFSPFVRAELINIADQEPSDDSEESIADQESSDDSEESFLEIVPESMLVQAAANGDLQFINENLAFGFDVNIRDGDGDTALIAAVTRHHLAVVQRLLAHPNIDVNIFASNGWTALTIAACHGHLAIVERLLAHPTIDVHIANEYGFTALTVAAYKGHLAIVDRILAHPNSDANQIDNAGSTALINAACHGHLVVVERLLNHPNIDVNIQNRYGDTALMSAVSENKLEIVMVLLTRLDLDLTIPNHSGDTALTTAIRWGNPAIIDRLLSDARTYTQNIGPALVLAAQVNNFNVVERLLNTERLLAQTDLEINTQDNTGKTALMYAISNHKVAMVHLLLAQPGINVNIRSQDGLTVLDMTNDDYIRMLLIAHGAVSGQH